MCAKKAASAKRLVRSGECKAESAIRPRSALLAFVVGLVGEPATRLSARAGSPSRASRTWRPAFGIAGFGIAGFGIAGFGNYDFANCPAAA